MYAYAQSKVEICGVNTAKLQTLKNDEMRELLDRSHHGDKDARDKLICGNLRLVLSVIQRFTSRGENPDDLFQVGCIGLIKAIDNFGPSHEVMFSTYGVPMISGEVKRFLRDNNAVRVSRSMRDTAYRAMQIKEQLTNENGKEPNITEIAKRMAWSCRPKTLSSRSNPSWSRCRFTSRCFPTAATPFILWIR